MQLNKQMNTIKIISELDELQNIKFDNIAFPKIDYLANLKLNLNSTTLLAAYTTISKRVEKEYIEEIEWRTNGDINWQNKILEYLANSIYRMIGEYELNQSDFLLTKIFIWIQLWGGNSGRAIFVRKNGWPNNFDIEVYKNGVELILKENYLDALDKFNTLYGVSTAFSTKHIHFWSKSNAPIYDSIIAAIIFGRDQTQIRAKEYPTYLNALEELKSTLNNSEIDVSSIERNLFNWANSDDGIKWRELRLKS